MSRQVICVIPARMASSRFPGKPLEKIQDLPIINHIYRRCKLSENLDQVIVATCDDEIRESIEKEDGQVIMTHDRHERCTDRVEEAISKLEAKLNDDDFILMVQGDEIFIDPDMIDKMIESYHPEKNPVVNLASIMLSDADKEDVNTVKVVTDIQGNALYMSRESIPSRKRSPHDKTYQQTGIIGFSKKSLHQFSSLEQTPMEQIESVDMLRFIENGINVKIIKVDRETIGVDTPADKEKAEEIMKNDPYATRYLIP